MIYKRIKNKYIFFSISAVVVIFIVGAAFVVAIDGSWHDPSAPPPGDNAATPINVLGGVEAGQTKEGQLILNNGLHVSGDFDIGGGSPANELYVDGNIRVRGSNGLIFSNGSIKEAPPICRANDDKYLTWTGSTWGCNDI